MLNKEDSFLKYLENYTSKNLQVIFFDEAGSILWSNNSLSDISAHYGESIQVFSQFMESIYGEIEKMENDSSIFFPRMEIPIGGRDGYFDYTINKRMENGITYYAWVIHDNTQQYKVLLEIQQKHHNEHLKRENASSQAHKGSI